MNKKAKSKKQGTQITYKLETEKNHQAKLSDQKIYSELKPL